VPVAVPADARGPPVHHREEPHPIAHIEKLAMTARPDAVVTIETTLGELFPNSEAPDQPVFGYADPRAYGNLLEGIRQQLLHRLFGLMPAP
jgi:hypothetical protein